MNKVILIGNVCAKPEAHTTQGGIARSSFKLAVRRRFKNEQGNYDADFLPVIAWRGTADYCNRYLDKGSRIAVDGVIQTRSYDAQDGSKRYVTEIIADHIESLGGREEKQEAVQKPAQDFQEMDDPDLPF